MGSPHALVAHDLGRRADADHGEADREPRKALLQNLDVAVLRCPRELGADLGQPRLDRLVGASALDEDRRVRGDDHPARVAERLRSDVRERQPGLLGDHLPAGERGEVAEVMDAPVPEARGADGDRLDRPVLVVGNEHAERRAVDLLGQDHERPRRLHDLLERWQEVLGMGDRPARHEDVRVLEHGLHVRGVAHHVRRDPAVLDVHTLDELEGDPRHVGLLDGDDTVGADTVQRLGDRLADQLVVLGRDRRDVRELVASLHRPRHAPQLGDEAGGRLLDAAAQQHRVDALVERLHALAHDGLGEQRGGRRPIAREVARLVGDLADELRAHVLELV